MFTIRPEHRAPLAKQFTGNTLVGEFTSRGYQAAWLEKAGEVHVTDLRGQTAQFKIDDDGKLFEGTTPLGRKFQYGYDSNRRLNSVVNPAGTRVSCEYDESDLIRKLVRDPDRRLAFEWDKWGNLTKITFPDQTTSAMTYRELDRFTEYSDRIGRTTKFDRSESGLLKTITDPSGNKTHFQYAEVSLPAHITLADGSREDIVYDTAGRLSSSSINGQRWADISWAGPGRIKTIRFADGHFLDFDYDAAGNVVEARNPSITVKRQFDEKNRLVQEDQGGQVVKYSYDPSGLLTCLTTPTGDTMKFGHDADERLVQIEDWNGGLNTFQYDPNGRVVRHQLPNGLVTRTTLAAPDLAAEIQTSGSGLGPRPLSLRFEYDLDDRIRLLSDSELGTKRLSYDSEGQLLRVQSSAASGGEHFKYDLNGNRTKANAEDAEFNSVNQITRQGKTRFSYDSRGNLVEQVSQAGATRYTYNGQNLLVAVDLPDARRIEFAYDAFARRIWKRAGGVTTRYVWAGHQLLCEFTEGGALPAQRDYLFLPGTHTPLAMRVNGTVYACHTDQKGAPRWLTDPIGRMVWSAEYSAFGKTVLRAEDVKQDLRFPGQYFDEETGLHYNRARYYSPELGRYLSRDPVQLIAAPNLYLYSGNDPINGCDPVGLLGFWNAVIGGALLVGAAALVILTAPVSLVAIAAVVVGGAALCGAAAGVLTAPDNCFQCMALGALKGAATGAALGMMAMGLFIAGPGAAAAMGAIAVGGAIAAEAGGAIAAGAAIVAAGVMMMSQANKMPGSEKGGGSEGESGGSDEKSGTSPETPKVPEDPSQPPNADWEWRGQQPPGNEKGAWYNPKTGETLHPDLNHPDPVGPHWDYRAPDGTFYRILPDGSMVPR